MGTHARITSDGRVSIDVDAWLARRTNGVLDDLTTALQAWPHQPGSKAAHPQTIGETTAPADLAQAWLRHLGARPKHPGLIVHHHGRLPARTWILRADTPTCGAIAVVAVPGRRASVYRDTAEDSWTWHDHAVDIRCPRGHRWSWRTRTELLTADGRPTTISQVFGTDIDAPLRPCPHCLAHSFGHPDPCDCDGTAWIICPTCGRRCDIELPRRP